MYYIMFFSFVHVTHVHIVFLTNEPRTQLNLFFEGGVDFSTSWVKSLQQLGSFRSLGLVYDAFGNFCVWCSFEIWMLFYPSVDDALSFLFVGLWSIKAWYSFFDACHGCCCWKEWLPMIGVGAAYTDLHPSLVALAPALQNQVGPVVLVGGFVGDKMLPCRYIYI